MTERSSDWGVFDITSCLQPLHFSDPDHCVSASTACVELTAEMTDRFGTVLGFVISYRTSASFERYNEGRRYWSSITLSSRVLARMIWFHVPRRPGDNFLLDD